MDSRRYGIAVFATLREMEPGDVIVVTDRGGIADRYGVVASQQIAKPALPAELFKPDQPAGLALITCGGAFDTVRRYYPDNIIVLPYRCSRGEDECPRKLRERCEAPGFASASQGGCRRTLVVRPWACRARVLDGQGALVDERTLLRRALGLPHDLDSDLA